MSACRHQQDPQLPAALSQRGTTLAESQARAELGREITAECQQHCGHEEHSQAGGAR